MEKFGNFKFIIYKNTPFDGFFYKILDEKETIIKLSKEGFAFEGIARLAAIGHITVLEQNENEGHSLKCP